MTAAERIATASRRIADRLARRGRTAPVAEASPVTWHLHPHVARALQAAVVQERTTGEDGRPRLIVSIPGFAPFFAGDEKSTGEALQARFPELKTQAEVHVATRFMADAYRQHVRNRRRASSFARNW